MRATATETHSSHTEAKIEHRKILIFIREEKVLGIYLNSNEIKQGIKL